MVLAPVVRERKGEYGKLLEEMRAPGLRPRRDRRRAAPPRRGDRARQEVQARHLDRRRPPGDEGGRAQAAGRVARGRLAARRGPGRDRDPRPHERRRGRRARGPGAKVLSGPSAGKRGEVLLFSEKFACLNCGTSMPELEPRIFSFNSPHGCCQRCHGLGFQRVIDPELIVPDPTLSISEGALEPWTKAASIYHRRLLEAVAEANGIDTDVPVARPPGCGPRAAARGHRRRAPHDLLSQPLRPPAQVHGPLRRACCTASSAATRTPTRRTPASGSRR